MAFYPSSYYYPQNAYYYGSQFGNPYQQYQGFGNPYQQYQINPLQMFAMMMSQMAPFMGYGGYGMNPYKSPSQYGPSNPSTTTGNQNQNPYLPPNFNAADPNGASSQWGGMKGFADPNPQWKPQAANFAPTTPSNDYGSASNSTSSQWSGNRGMADPNPQWSSSPSQMTQGEWLNAQAKDFTSSSPFVIGPTQQPLEQHQDSDYESWIKAGGLGYGYANPTWGASSSSSDNGGNALGTLAGGASTASSSSSSGTSTGTYSDSDPFGGLKNRPPDF